MKFKAKSLLAMAVLLSVMSVGTMAEAAEISGNKDADDITEDSTVGGPLTLRSGVLNYILTNNSHVYFEGATKMNAAVNGGYLHFYNNIIVTNADYINGVVYEIRDCTVTLQGGTLTKKVQGTGNLDFAGDVSTNADNIATTGTNTVESGAKLTFTGGTLIKNITGDGTTEFNNTVSVADGVNLGTATNNVNGTLDVVGNITAGNINVNGTLNAAGNITAGNINVKGTLDVMEHITASNIKFKNDSTLKVDGRKVTDTPAINVTAGATVKSGAKLYVSNAVGGTPYKILAGSGINVSGWQTDAEMGDGFWAAYGLVVDKDNITYNSNEFTIQFKKDPLAQNKLDILNIYTNMPMDSKLQNFIDNISQANSDISTQATIINTMANMNSLANVQQGTQAVMAMATDALQTNIGTGARAILGRRAEGVGRNSGVRGQVSGVRNVSANADDRGAIEVVEQGKRDEVMPVMVENEPQKYDKTVWANYIHSKKTIDGLKTGRLTQNSTIQYNGVTVGADLWSNAKGFGGLALTTAEGKTNSSQDGASVKNDTDYHGVSLYQRYDYKDVALLFDLSYTHAKNDVTMSTAGTTDVTAKPKSDAYSAGVKVEYPVKIGHSSQLTPYTGVRYTHIHTDKYDNSLGISNDIKDQNLVNIPIGVQLKTEYTTNTDWKFGHIFEGGYVWNVGNRQSEQRLGYLGVYDSIDFDVTERAEYFLKTAFTARHKDTDFELGYRFTRGDNTKDNKWNFNVTYNFGNANGLPYKSVLLGKIDLLESANKALRAENVAFSRQVKELQMAVTDLQAENERLRAMLRAKG